MTPEDQRAARRAAMTQVTALVESLERDGYEPRVIFAQENGITVGKRPSYAEVFDIPKEWGLRQSRAVRKGSRG